MAGGPGVLAEEGERLAVHQREEGLVRRGPHAVPRPVEGVRHGRAQHAIQVHLRHLAPRWGGGGGTRGGRHVKRVGFRLNVNLRISEQANRLCYVHIILHSISIADRVKLRTC